MDKRVKLVENAAPTRIEHVSLLGNEVDNYNSRDISIFPERTQAVPQPPENNDIIKEFRDIDEVHAFLQKHFIELSWFEILNLYFIGSLSTVFNVFYICYTWSNYALKNNHNEEPDVRIYQSMINWFEFFGLCFMSVMLVYGIVTKKYNFVCDYYQMLGNWSAFKLFYSFRYTYIIE